MILCGVIMLVEIEEKLISALKEIFPTFDVESFPTDFKNFAFTSFDGCLLVKYSTSNFSEQTTIWATNQNETLEYKIFLGLHYLQNSSEANPYIDSLRDCLAGLNILKHKVTLKLIKIEGEDKGELWYSITINLKQELQDSKKYEGRANDKI